MRHIAGETALTGIIGYPLIHSLSPLMHNKAFQALGINYVYVPFPVKPHHLAQAVSALPVLGIKGVNVTIPYKRDIIDYLDEVTETAKLMQAVNTIVNDHDRLIGYNTDGQGFLLSLQEQGFIPQNRQVLILGAGGSCRAIAVILCLQKIKKLTLAGRNLGRAEALAVDLSKHFALDLAAKNMAHLTKADLTAADLIINTTPVGMYPNIEERLPIDTRFLHNRQLVYDLIYNPRETIFLREAKHRGCTVINGLSMLVYQGAEAFALWTGRQAPIAIMRSAVQDMSDQDGK